MKVKECEYRRPDVSLVGNHGCIRLLTRLGCRLVVITGGHDNCRTMTEVWRQHWFSILHPLMFSYWSNTHVQWVTHSRGTHLQNCMRNLMLWWGSLKLVELSRFSPTLQHGPSSTNSLSSSLNERCRILCGVQLNQPLIKVRNCHQL